MVELASQQDDSVADVGEEISQNAQSMLDNFVDSLPRIGVALAVIIVGYVLSRWLRSLLRRFFCRSHTKSFANVMSRLAGWALLSVFVMSALAVAFPSVKPVDLLAGLGFFSVAVGFAFQDILENTLSGVLLLIRQPFESGDQIEVQGQTGTVEGITIRETRLKTFDGQMILIPNRDVYKNVIRVQTHFPERRQAFVVGIAFENDAREASQVIMDALRSVEGVILDPAPEALVSELGVSTVDIEARFWCDALQHNSRLILDDAIVTVKYWLEDAGIEMPADIIALQATPSFKAAVQGDGNVTPGGAIQST